jgi:hypothetical protein
VKGENETDAQSAAFTTFSHRTPNGMSTERSETAEKQRTNEKLKNKK